MTLKTAKKVLKALDEVAAVQPLPGKALTVENGTVYLEVYRGGSCIEVYVERLRTTWAWTATLPAAGNHMELSGHTKTFPGAYRAALKGALEIYDMVRP